MTYYVAYSSGKLKEVDRKEYMEGFNNPFVTLLTIDHGITTIDQITKENEDEDFRSLGFSN